MKTLDVETSEVAESCGCGSCADHLHDAVVHDCAAAADALLSQAAAFVGLFDDSVYARPCETASSGTIGKHVRHVLDHFSAIFAAADVGACGIGAIGEVIDYDHRERDVPMESSRRLAAAAIMVLRSQIRGLTYEDMDAPVMVRVMVSQDGRTVDLASTLGREVAFATHHALHHHAMMRFIAASFGVQTPEEFGKAPSTLRYEEQRH